MSPASTVICPLSSRNSAICDDAFGLVADVDDDFGGRHLEDRALDDLAFRDVPEAVIVDVEELGVLLGVDRVVVVARPGLQRVLVGAVDLSFRAFGPLGGCDATAGRVFSSSTFAMPCRSSWSIDCRYWIAGAGTPRLVASEHRRADPTVDV